MPYPLDLTGVAASNLITNELHISTEQNINNHYYIFPQYMSFYKNSFVAKMHNGSTWVTLTPNVDYVFKAIHLAATRVTGKELYGFIELINPTVNTTISLTYQTLGGSKQPDVNTLINTIIDKNKITPVDVLDVLTTDFDPAVQIVTPNFNDYPNTKGELEVVEKLHEIANKIAEGYVSISNVFRNYARTNDAIVIDFSVYINKAGDQLNVPFNVVTFPSIPNNIVNKSYVENAFNDVATSYNNLTNTYNNKLTKSNPVANGPLYLNTVDSLDTKTALTKQYVENALSNVTPINSDPPIGTIIQLARDEAPPGYLKCNGAAVSKTTYSALYSVIGDAFTPMIEDAGIPWQSQCGFNPSIQKNIIGWTNTNNLVVSTIHAATLVTKNYIYLLGGYNGSALNNIQRASFDSKGYLTTTWSNIGTLPVQMYSMGYVATRNRFYLIGGINNSNHLSTVYSVAINEDGTLGAFRTETPLPNPRYASTCFVIKDKLYVVGGRDSSNNYTNTIYRTTINNDGALSSWETLPNFPINTGHGRPMLIKNRIYIFGAYHYENNTNTSKIYYATFDNSGNIGPWIYVSNMPSNIYGSSIVCTDNYVFSIGGSSDSNNQSTDAIYRAPILSDGSIGAWTQIGNAPVAAYYAQAVIAGNKIYFIGGLNNTGSLNTVYSASFTSGITDYTPYYTDQPNTSTTFYLPDLPSTSYSAYYIKT